jgi:hypothetical protein
MTSGDVPHGTFIANQGTWEGSVIQYWHVSNSTAIFFSVLIVGMN